ncbi:MAG: PD40 domain-containing protein [Kordiimonadaceae bacterium]|nr:PD40 domain-containing protein [Kordiimonadaceae bacterium]MBO6569937.1 PD40 domain-containing protein [Kordiimonadaceae bacterium]MBO6965966.1 PD40 domain-containing protein [Kordiimonadaceae bacterium]
MRYLLALSVCLGLSTSPFVQAQPALTALTSFDGEDREPAPSPSGEWLAYLSDRKGDRSNELWLMNLITGAERRLFEQALLLGPPVWTKDGKHIILSQKMADAAARIHSIDVETGQLSGPLVPSFAQTGDQLFPDISPDGRTLALTIRTDSGGLDVYLASMEDGSVTRLTNHPQNDLWPRFNGSGTGIYFFSRRATEGQSDDIFYMTLSTRTVTRLTDAKDHDFVPSPAPNGQFIAFAARRSGSPELYVMGRDGQNQRHIETPGMRISHPVWGSAGKKIYFTGRPLAGGPADIYVVSFD